MTTTVDPTIEETERKLLAFCRQHGLFKPGDRVIAACSGGADSMALLLFLIRCRRRLFIRVLATHVDHGIRGEASRRDADFVRQFCRSHGIELFVYDAVREGVQIPDHPSEDWARRLRYGWFDTLARREEAKIATAHTLSDQAETILFRLARGTGVHGMAGIPARRGVYVRPCLCLTGAETAAYCRALGQSYVQDFTNETDDYARNRIRHHAMPALASANPAAERAIGRFCSQMQELDAWLSAEAAALLQAATLEDGYDIQRLRAADGPVLKAALHSLVSPVRDAEEKYVSLLRFLILRGEGALQLTPQVTYQVRDGLLRRVAPPGSLPPPAPPQPALAGIYRLPGGFVVQIETQNYEDFLKNAPIFKKDLNCGADYDKIQKSILLRTRQPGDFFRPAGRHVRKSLKKLFNELGTSLADRALMPLLADGSEVLWLYGCGFAEGLAPDASTRRVLAVHAWRDTEE
ncbi:tRNA lysidine(34) synthetase TilS [uncultured Gemmiger sp.]|uniref:tRNA lysidine(34) synthetase TilS n=1 Tax=uncultured Gemmiger sp. TaxID=1623490 RepID=UPI0025D670EA|nr:tRNA lysidine(34) synthetase TilS [uncultured Gemmiger sp.]